MNFLLQDILNEFYQNSYAKEAVRCPVCCNKTCFTGEYVEHAKVGPDWCDICGWREGNGTEMYPDNYEYVTKCWELQIDPYPIN